MRPIIPGLAIAAALLIAAFPAGAKPEARAEDDAFVLQNEHVTIRFLGQAPSLWISPASDPDAGYSLALDQVVEWRDLDADGLLTDAEIVARLALDDASAFVTNVSGDESRAWIEFALQGSVRLTGAAALDNVTIPTPTPADREASVRLVFSLGEANRSVDVSFVVEAWPFVDAEADRLALDLRAEASGEADGTRLDLASNSSLVGRVAWDAEAAGTDAAGENVTVPVKAASSPMGNATRLVLAYDAAGLSTIHHASTAGVASAESPADGTAGDDVDESVDAENTVPGVGLLAAGAAAGLAAFALRRRR